MSSASQSLHSKGLDNCNKMKISNFGNSTASSTPSKASQQSTSVSFKDSSVKICKSSAADQISLSSVSELSTSFSESFKTKNSKPTKIEPTLPRNLFGNKPAPDRCLSQSGIQENVKNSKKSLGQDANLSSKITSFSMWTADPTTRMHFTIVSGMVVDIVGGKHKGKSVTFVKRTSERIQVIVEDKQFPVYLKAKNIQVRSQLRTSNETKPSEIVETITDYPGGKQFSETPTTQSLASRTVVLSTPSTGLYEYQTRVIMLTGTVVNIIGGKHKGMIGTLIRHTDKRVWVIVEGSHNPVMLLPENIQYQAKPKNDVFGHDLELQTVINRCFHEAKEEFPMLHNSSFMKNGDSGIRA